MLFTHSIPLLRLKNRWLSEVNSFAQYNRTYAILFLVCLPESYSTYAVLMQYPSWRILIIWCGTHLSFRSGTITSPLLEDVTVKFAYIADGDVKWFSALGNGLAVAPNVERRASILLSKSALRDIPKRTENVCPHKYFYMYIQIQVAKKWK